MRADDASLRTRLRWRIEYALVRGASAALQCLPFEAGEAFMRLVARAYETVRYYRDLMDRCRLPPHRIRSPEDYAQLPILTKSIVQEEGVKRILSDVPVEPDGSVYFVAPAGRSLYFQLLDADRRCLQTMRSFTGVMPGELRGCVGCHESFPNGFFNKRYSLSSCTLWYQVVTITVICGIFLLRNRSSF